MHSILRISQLVEVDLQFYCHIIQFVKVLQKREKQSIQCLFKRYSHYSELFRNDELRKMEKMTQINNIYCL